MEPFKNLLKFDYEKNFNTDNGKVDLILYLKKMELLKTSKDTLKNRTNSFLVWLDNKITESNKRQRQNFSNDIFKMIYKKHFKAFEEYENNKWWFSNNPIDLVYYQLECLEKHNVWLTTFSDFTQATICVFEKASPNLKKEDITAEAMHFYYTLNNYAKSCNYHKLTKYKQVVNEQKQKDSTIDFERDVVIE